MQVQLNTDDHIAGRESLAQYVDEAVRNTLSRRFGDQLTRVEVHLSDLNASRGGDSDKRCRLEARPAGHQPIAVSHDAARVHEAFNGALHKLERALDSTLGRLRDAASRHAKDSPAPVEPEAETRES